MSILNEKREELVRLFLMTNDKMTQIEANALVQGIEEIINAYKEDLRK
jgi:hypothetical protein